MKLKTSLIVKKCLKCLNCYIDFESISNRNVKFCSRKCSGQYKVNNGIFNICERCGLKFHVQKNNSHQKYCSFDCYKNLKQIKCEFCEKLFNIHNYRIHLAKFCSKECHNKSQEVLEIKLYTCKFCKKEFSSKEDRVYCCRECYDNDKETLRENGIKTCLKLQNHKGPNKLELKGRYLLEKLEYILYKDFFEQVTLYNICCVDILFPDKKIIIQWDGIYWHNKPKRAALDISQDNYLIKCGYKIIRVKDFEFKDEIKLIEKLKELLCK